MFDDILKIIICFVLFVFITGVYVGFLLNRLYS